MTRTLRDYQERTVGDVIRALATGARVLVVAPCGAGKTTIGAAVVLCRSRRTLWVAHRLELVSQAAERLRAEGLSVGTIVGSESTDRSAQVNVGTVQTLVNSSRRPEDIGLVVLDEAHHFSADQWKEVHLAYPEAELVGLTATPQSETGEGLGNVFSLLVVAASYSELIRGGYLCPCPRENVLAPPPDLQDFDLACHPLEAWKRYGQGRSTLAYCSGVKQGQRFAEAFRQAGIPTGFVSAETPPDGRRKMLEQFSEGKLRVLWSVGILTEGVDLPITACVLLARPCELQRTYLQITGRELRPHPSKRDAILIDLVGATRVHGTPAEDRHYVLVGTDPIRRADDTPLRQCFQCGKFIAAHLRVCSECGYRFGVKGKRAPRIGNLELAAVYAGEATPADAIEAQIKRWVETAEQEGYAIGWITANCRRMFGITPDLSKYVKDGGGNQKAKKWAELETTRRAKGYKSTWTGVQFKIRFGFWPDRATVAEGLKILGGTSAVA